MNVGRNEPCPCGSGAKYKRCCLERRAELERLVGRLEHVVGVLGALAHYRWPDAYESAFCEFYGDDSFGWDGPSDEERLEAELWIVCDRDLGAGESTLRFAQRDSGEHAGALEALAASRIRAWRIEELSSAGPIAARCPLTGEGARLETVRPPAGEAAPGRMIVARSVSLGERRFALLGRAPVVEPAVENDFGELLAQVAGKIDEDGGLLLSAAWRWPEERDHVFEGTVASDAHAAWDLHDLDAAIELLAREPRLVATDPEARDEPDVESWYLIASEGGQPAEPPAEPGVRWTLVEEDVAEPRQVALVEVDPYDGRLWLHAPTSARLEQIERKVRRALGGLIGEQFCHDSEDDNSSFRWQRERWERSLTLYAGGADRGPAMHRAA